MSRSKWKGPYLDSNFLSNKEVKAYKEICRSRATTVMPAFIGKNFKIHNGYKFVQVKVSGHMIGHKFGEFVSTRKPFKYKK